MRKTIFTSYLLEVGCESMHVLENKTWKMKEWMMKINTLPFTVVLRGKAHYQRGYNAHYCGFKLDTKTFVLSIPDVDLYSNIKQACIALLLHITTYHDFLFTDKFLRKRSTVLLLI